MIASHPPQRYSLYGLTVESCVPFDAPPSLSGGPADIQIRYGVVAALLDGATLRGSRFEAGPGELLVDVPGVARYFAKGGDTVVIERCQGATDESVALFLLGSVMAGILHQRRDLVLHGAAISTGGGAVAFLGRSGSGKSTIAAGLVRRGHALFADDVCVLRLMSGAWCVQPGLPRTTLWPDSLEQHEVAAASLPRVRQEIDKRVWRTTALATAARPLTAAYLLEPTNTSDLRIAPVEGADGFHALLRQTYRPLIQRAVASDRDATSQTLSLAAQVRVARVIRPQYPFRLPELLDQIEADLRR